MSNTVEFGPRQWQLAFKVAMRVLKSRPAAEDAAQDALLRAFRRRATYDGSGSFEGWLRRIALNTAISQLRPKSRTEIPIGDCTVDSAALFPSKDPSPEALAAGRELATCLNGCLRTLSELDRFAFTERFLAGTSERELGERLTVSTNAAKQRAFRARRAVRNAVAEAGWTPPGRRAA